MHTRTQTFLAAALLLGGPFLEAQEAPAADPPETARPNPPKPSEIEQLKQQVRELKDRVDKAATTDDTKGIQADVENFKYQYQHDRDTKTALSNRNLLITGTVQARFIVEDPGVTSPGLPTPYNTIIGNPPITANRQSSFDIPNAIVGFSGLLYKDYKDARNLGFNLSIDAFPTTSDIGATEGTAVNSFMSVLDANIAYQALPTIENDGDRLSITFGQQLIPFGTEAFTTEDLKPVIDNALWLNPTGFNQRQIGLVVSGQFFTRYDFGYNYRQALLNVAFGVDNGNGFAPNANNNHKARISRVALTIPADYLSWLRELRIGASLYQGQDDVLGGSPSAATLIGQGLQNRYGYDIYYNHFPFGFTYEHVRLVDTVGAGQGVLGANGYYGSPSLSPSQAYRLDRTGGTTTLFYSFGEQFLSSIKSQAKFDDWWPKTYQPFIRFDTFNQNEGIAGQRVSERTLGFNVFFAETTKVQFNYNKRDQQQTNGPVLASSEYLFQVQFGF